ncbi:MAG: hypothetical protein AB1792_09060 [Candidatus Zixiibacteriota bacterium]
MPGSTVGIAAVTDTDEAAADHRESGMTESPSTSAECITRFARSGG